MAIYSHGRTGGVGTTGVASAEIRTAATDRCRILEIGVFLTVTTASQIGLGRPAARGTTPTSPVTVLAEDPAAPAGTTTSAIAWSTPPTVPANFLRTINLPATIGAGVIWTFPQGLMMAISDSVVIWNMATNGVISYYFVVDE